MEKYINDITEKITKGLISSGLRYFQTALEINRKEFKGYADIQTLIGNLSISVELMLKGYLSGINPLLIYKSLPNDMKLAFLAPAEASKVNYRIYDADIRSFDNKFKTIEIDELLSLFFIINPSLKQELKPYTKDFVSIRNISVHGAILPINAYFIDKVLYLSARVFLELFKQEVTGICGFIMEKDVNTILDTIDEKRMLKVKKAIEEAKTDSKKMRKKVAELTTDEWDEFITCCPVCDTGGLLKGYTDAEEISYEEVDLVFFAETFECSGCGLKLHDVKELDLAGLETIYAREEDWEDWIDYYYR